MMNFSNESGNGPVDVTQTAGVRELVERASDRQLRELLLQRGSPAGLSPGGCRGRSG